MKYLLLLLCLSSFVFANKAMSERMQSVVDEVTELRERYEEISRKNDTCEADLIIQKKEMSKISHHEGFDYEAFERNREKLANLEKEYIEYENLCEKSQLEKSTWIDSLKLELQEIEQKNRTLKNTNEKLSQEIQEDMPETKTLSEKNKTLEKSLLKSKKELKLLQKELLNLRTEIDNLKQNRQTKETQKLIPKVRVIKEIKTKKVYVDACKDDNPFPKLMMKNDKSIRPLKVEPKTIIKEANSKEILSQKSYTYRMRTEAKIYNSIDGDFIETWEEQTSFTSNLSKGGWIMITGYFLNKKWIKAKAEMWVLESDTVKR